MPSTPVADLMREESPAPIVNPDDQTLGTKHTKQKSCKSARSVEHLRLPLDDRRVITIRKASTDSSNSLPNVAIASSNPSRRHRSGSTPPTQDRPLPTRGDSMGIYETTSPQVIRTGPEPDSLGFPPRAIPSPSGRRSAPPVPPPVKRRKPPAIPTNRSPKLDAVNGGGKNMNTIGPTITSSPLSQDF